MYTVCEQLYVGLEWTGKNFSHETELICVGDTYVVWLLFYLAFIVTQHFPPPPIFFFHTYNEELQKTSQINVLYFTFN